MKTYEYILLDWDGNLARTLDLWLEAARTVLEKRGLKLSDEQIASSFGAFERQWAAWGVKDVEMAIDEAYLDAKRRASNVELYPDAAAVLENLHERGKKLALITTSSREIVWHLLEKHNLTGLFEVVVVGDEVTRIKPDPEGIEKALTELQGSKDSAIMIGDTEKDVVAAKNAGIDSILFYPDEHKKYYDLAKLRQYEPTHVVSNFHQILEIV